MEITIKEEAQIPTFKHFDDHDVKEELYSDNLSDVGSIKMKELDLEEPIQEPLKRAKASRAVGNIDNIIKDWINYQNSQIKTKMDVFQNVLLTTANENFEIILEFGVVNNNNYIILKTINPPIKMWALGEEVINGIATEECTISINHTNPGSPYILLFGSPWSRAQAASKILAIIRPPEEEQLTPPDSAESESSGENMD